MRDFALEERKKMNKYLTAGCFFYILYLIRKTPSGAESIKELQERN